MPDSSSYFIDIAGQSVARADRLDDDQDARDSVARGQALGTIAVAAAIGELARGRQALADRESDG